VLLLLLRPFCLMLRLFSLFPGGGDFCVIFQMGIPYFGFSAPCRSPVFRPKNFSPATPIEDDREKAPR